MARNLTSILAALALLVALASPAAAANAAVRRTILTSSWATPSPDPTGIAVLPSGALLVVDSEVDETPLATGKNMWRATPAGEVKATLSTLSFSTEPTDVAVNGAGSTWYFSDDRAFGGSPGKIFVRNLGPDGRYGTSDDSRRSFSTFAMGATDPEALAFGGNSLWVGDGTNRQVFRIQPGANGLIEGGGDDVITSFSVEQFGILDLEGIAYKDNGNLLVLGNQPDPDIAEVTAAGQLVRLIDLARVPLVAPSGIAIGPSSRDPSRNSIYLTDRGVDNGTDPGENDGRIFEIGTTAPPANLVNNSSFERDVDGDGTPDSWSANANFSRSSDVAHLGTYSGKHGPGAEATYSVRQTLASVRANASYQFSGWVNIPDTIDEFGFQIRVAWFGSDGATLGSSGIKGFSASTANWVEVTRTVTAPPGTIFGKLVMSTSLMSATVYVDAFELTSLP